MDINKALKTLHYFEIPDDLPDDSQDENDEDHIEHIRYLREKLKEMLPELKEGNTDPTFIRNISRVIAELQKAVFGKVDKHIELKAG